LLLTAACRIGVRMIHRFDRRGNVVPDRRRYVFHPEYESGMLLRAPRRVSPAKAAYRLARRARRG
jgi:hypothetical protein